MSFTGSFLLLLLTVLFTLSSSKTVQWTRAGGSASWDYGPNWDTQTVPTSTDDVIIDLTLIDGDVQIGAAPAFCNSLKIGGTSGRPQRLTILNALTIGTGGGQIMSNGRLVLQSSSSSPLSCSGVFSGGSTFLFESGTISGSGSFSFDYLALNGSALKVFSTKVSVSGIVDVNPGMGLGVVNIQTGKLTIAGTLRTSATVTMSSSPGASLDVTGTFAFSGGATDVFTIRGDATIAKMTVASGTVTLNDNVTIASTSIASGATVNVIGGMETIRNFGDITGSGVLQIQGGTNTVSTFTSFGSVQLSGGTLVAKSSPSVIFSYSQTGGTLTSTTTVIISSASVTSGVFSKATLSIAGLNVKGFFSLDSSSVTLSGNTVIGVNSQFTLSNAASITTTSTCTVSQSMPFKLLPASSDNSFVHNGKWTSTSDLQILILTSGGGAFQFGAGSTTSITGITFTTGSLTFSGGSFTSVSCMVTISNVVGTGTIISQGQSFTVTNTLTATSYSNINGITVLGGGAIQSLSISTGTFNITGSSATAGTTAFSGGTILGASQSGTVFSSSSIMISGNQYKNIQDITLKTANMTLMCGADACQLGTLDATIQTVTKTGLLNLIEKKRFV